MKLFYCALGLLTSLAVNAAYFDLSHDFSSSTLNWPTTQRFVITHALAENDHGFYVALRDYASNEHASTHLDAPCHFAKGHAGISAIPLTDLIGNAIKVDVRAAVSNHPDYQVNVTDFKRWENKHGIIPKHSIVLLQTGYGQFWPNQALYTGTQKTGEASVSAMHFPGLDPAAAQWLVQERNIKAIGIDTFSIDYGQTKQFKTHQFLTAHDIPIFENVADMKQVPANNFTVYALPMKIKDGTGAPLRIVAKVKD